MGRTLTRADGTTTSSYHYGGDGDSADWVVDASTTTRYVPGPGGLSAVHQVFARQGIEVDIRRLYRWKGNRGGDD